MHKGSSSLQDEISGAAAEGRVLLIPEEEMMAEPLGGCEELWWCCSFLPTVACIPCAAGAPCLPLFPVLRNQVGNVHSWLWMLLSAT